MKKINHTLNFHYSIHQNLLLPLLFILTQHLANEDNGSSQFKSAPPFINIQELSDKYKIKVICIYSIAGHEKGEVDHVGCLAKVAMRREIGAGVFFADAEDMVMFLQSKFNEKGEPVYQVKGIDVRQLEVPAAAKLKFYHTLKGSNEFHVIVFYPKTTTV